jgi:predicted dienelactone hydrolase
MKIGLTNLTIGEHMKRANQAASSIVALSLLVVGCTFARTKTQSTELMIGATAKGQGTRQSPLPAPTGTYSVGRTQFDWTDEARADPENHNGHREIIVWVWYPASPRSGAEPAEWMPGKWGELFWSDFVSRHPVAGENGKEHPINANRTHAYPDASVASAQKEYPVLLFAPGLGTTPLDYSSLIEDVVSHGYIVAAIVPTYLARFSVFSDGRVIEGHDIMDAQGGIAAAPHTADQAMKRFEQVAAIWSNDMIFTLNQLSKVNADARSPLKGHLDFNRVGAFGHSMGGAAVLQFATDDRRVRAVFDIDGSPTWNAANKDLAKPLLVLSAASTNVGYDAVLSGAKPGNHLRLSGSVHRFANDFGLIPFISQAPRSATQSRPPEVSSIDPARALRITETYVEAFFDQYLNGKTAALLKGPSPDYPEIVFEH